MSLLDSSPRRLLRVGATLLVLLAAGGLANAQTYWFETYERAVELIESDRLDEAQALLADVIKDHPVPRSAIRVPGNRFIHYLPYFQQARIQVERGDYDLAAHNLDVSEAFGAIRFDRRRLAELQDLRLVTTVKQSHKGQSSDPPATLAVQKTWSQP